MLCSVEDVKSETAPIIAYASSFGYEITDSQIERWIKEASAEAERLCRRTFVPRRQTEWYDGNDQTTLTVRRYPIIKVHKVKIWGGRHFLIWEFPEDKIVYEGKHTEEEYRQAELLVRSEIGELVITLGLLEWFQPLRMKPPLFIWNRRFLQGIQNIEVDYTAGYGYYDEQGNLVADPPWEVRRIVTVLSAIKLSRFAAAAGGGVVSRSLGDRSESYGGEGAFSTLERRWRTELYGDGRTPGLIDRLAPVYAR
jgi:hypothetical protein